MFVLTGDCKSRDKPGYTVYEDIAAASSGQVFRLEKNDVFDVVKFVRDTLDTNRVNLGSSINPPGDHEHKVDYLLSDYYFWRRRLLGRVCLSRNVSLLNYVHL